MAGNNEALELQGYGTNDTIVEHTPKTPLSLRGRIRFPYPVRLVRYGLGAAMLLASSTPVAPAKADQSIEGVNYPYCSPGEVPTLGGGFLDLTSETGLNLTPVECPHPNNANGDVLQAATDDGQKSWLLFWRKKTNTPTATDGYTHYALIASGLTSWQGESIDPPGLEPGALPTAGAVETPQPVVGEKYYSRLKDGLEIIDQTRPEDTDGLKFRIVERDPNAVNELLAKVQESLKQNPTRAFSTRVIQVGLTDEIFNQRGSWDFYVGIEPEPTVKVWKEDRGPSGWDDYIVVGNRKVNPSYIAFYPSAFGGQNLALVQKYFKPGINGAFSLNGLLVGSSGISVLAPDIRPISERSPYTIEVTYPSVDGISKTTRLAP